MGQDTLTQRFQTYFDRDVAQKAASSLANGAQIEIQIQGGDGKPAETFTFTRENRKNRIVPGPAAEPQLLFLLTEQAAEAILSDPSQEIGPIGVGIAKLILSPDASRRVSIRFKAGFLTLFTQGYFGVVTAGGAHFASYLASKGLNGMGAIKAALKKKAD
ncbi:MAG: hypothetical protein NDJ90_08715 [Oligoflexia bacterium]|nr:hypothetical protein [Oligoflexia bacterium]